MTQGH